MSQDRLTEHPIDPLFTRRWSPRAFTGEQISEAALFSLFEAARWAPSSYNSQLQPGKTESEALPSHSFDAGAAWASLAFQATISGRPTGVVRRRGGRAPCRT